MAMIAMMTATTPNAILTLARTTTAMTTTLEILALARTTTAAMTTTIWLPVI